MWQDKNGSLYKKFVFKDFKQAFDFMGRVAAIAEEQEHHPKWLNEWNSIEIWLSTHESGQITEKDHKLAKAIDEIERSMQ